jgi:hypothetical protein
MNRILPLLCCCRIKNNQVQQNHNGKQKIQEIKFFLQIGVNAVNIMPGCQLENTTLHV